VCDWWRVGKLLGLCYLLREHAGPLEADFQRYYQLDLLDLWRGRLSPRKAAVLAMQLPSGAQTWLSCGYDNAWTLMEYLTASLIDAVQAGNWQRAGDPKARKPDPVKRPADLRAQDRTAEFNDIKAQAFRDKQRRRQLEAQEA
jgi:hypothetical protein